MIGFPWIRLHQTTAPVPVHHEFRVESASEIGVACVDLAHSFARPGALGPNGPYLLCIAAAEALRTIHRWIRHLSDSFEPTTLQRALSRRLQRDAAQPARQRERAVRERAVRAAMPPEPQPKPGGSVVLRLAGDCVAATAASQSGIIHNDASATSTHDWASIAGSPDEVRALYERLRHLRAY